MLIEKGTVHIVSLTVQIIYSTAWKALEIWMNCMYVNTTGMNVCMRVCACTCLFDVSLCNSQTIQTNQQRNKKQHCLVFAVARIDVAGSNTGSILSPNTVMSVLTFWCLQCRICTSSIWQPSHIQGQTETYTHIQKHTHNTDVAGLLSPRLTECSSQVSVGFPCFPVWTGNWPIWWNIYYLPSRPPGAQRYLWFPYGRVAENV